MLNLRLPSCQCKMAAVVVTLALIFVHSYPLFAQVEINAKSDALDVLAADFWQWRARHQPFSQDDIPRIERPNGPRDWSSDSIVRQKAALDDFEKRWKRIDPKSWSVARQVNCRLLGSALARVRWELETNPRWQRDPSFYVDQTLTALLEVLVEPPPFTAVRSHDIVERMQQIPGIIEKGEANLRPVRPFAALAIADLQDIRPKLERVKRDVGPMLNNNNVSPGAGDTRKGNKSTLAEQFGVATDNAILALESYRNWLLSQIDSLPDNSAVGRENYEFFLHNVALLPYTPEELLSLSRQEWDLSVAF